MQLKIYGNFFAGNFAVSEKICNFAVLFDGNLAKPLVEVIRKATW